MTVLCLTGWQQAADALSPIAPHALHFDYSTYGGMEAVFDDLPRSPTLAIGWSLGGQLLVHAIAGGHVMPEMLILIATPFQCVADEEISEGMPPSLFEDFRTQYGADRPATAKRFAALVASDDVHERAISRTLRRDIVLWEQGDHWLDALGSATCLGLDFTHFPRTIVVHGERDKVIPHAQAELFALRMPYAKLMLLPDCGHAPHLHDTNGLRGMVAAYV